MDEAQEFTAAVLFSGGGNPVHPPSEPPHAKPGRPAGVCYNSTSFSGPPLEDLIVPNRTGDAMNPSPAKLLRSLLAILAVATIGSPLSAATATPQEAAAAVDKQLAEELFTPETKLAPQVDDAIFLRRVWLDITGDIPTPEHVTAFLLDPAKD